MDKRKLVIGPVMRAEDVFRAKYIALFNGVELPHLDTVRINTVTGYPTKVTLTFTVQ